MSLHASSRRSGRQLLVAWAAVALVLGVWIYLGWGKPSMVREILAVPFVLIAPGGLLTAILPSQRQDPFFRVALAVGLSISWCIASGLVLNLLPGGIDTRTWASALGGVSVVEAVIVAVRPRHVGDPRGDSSSMIAGRVGVRTFIVTGVGVLAALGGLLSVVAIERSNAEASYRQERFAELWADPAPGGSVVIGVRSDAIGGHRFRLLVIEGGRTIDTYTFTLDWHRSWTQRLTGASGNLRRSRISLFIGSSRQPPERVWYDPGSGA